MNIVQTQFPTSLQKKSIFKLWNNEYPASIAYQSINQLEDYLNGLSETNHFFMVDDSDESIIGWAFTFLRDNEKWFAIIIDSNYQGKKMGTHLLHHLKEKETELNGWVIESNDYIKKDGSPYATPVLFYSKNGFEILSDIKLENNKMKAVKIQWRKDMNG